MKKVLCILLGAAFALSACVVARSPISGSFVTRANVHGQFAEINLEELQGNMVEGRAMATGILGFVSGDCTYEAALQDALDQSGAKKLTNIIVAYEVKKYFLYLCRIYYNCKRRSSKVIDIVS